MPFEKINTDAAQIATAFPKSVLVGIVKVVAAS
jgi:hypothetical protein